MYSSLHFMILFCFCIVFGHWNSVNFICCLLTLVFSYPFFKVTKICNMSHKAKTLLTLTEGEEKSYI